VVVVTSSAARMGRRESLRFMADSGVNGEGEGKD